MPSRSYSFWEWVSVCRKQQQQQQGNFFLLLPVCSTDRHYSLYPTQPKESGTGYRHYSLSVAVSILSRFCLLTWTEQQLGWVDSRRDRDNLLYTNTTIETDSLAGLTWVSYTVTYTDIDLFICFCTWMHLIIADLKMLLSDGSSRAKQSTLAAHVEGFASADHWNNK